MILQIGITNGEES